MKGNGTRSKRKQHTILLLSISLVGGREVIEEATVHLHEGLEHVVDQGDDSLVPVLFTDPGLEEN